MLKSDYKKEIMKKFAKSDKDTGSSQVQIVVLSERIKQLAQHLKTYPKDKHSRFGLLKMVGKRRSFLSYLKKDDKAAYDVFLKRLKDESFI